MKRNKRVCQLSASMHTDWQLLISEHVRVDTGGYAFAVVGANVWHEEGEKKVTAPINRQRYPLHI